MSPSKSDDSINKSSKVLSKTNDLDFTARLELADIGSQLSDEEKNWILSLEKEVKDKLDLLSYLTEQVHREQEIYWSRFQGFAAIHAGSFVLVTSNVVEEKFVATLVGFFLGIAWIYVQWISLKYVDRPKRLYHWYRRSLGILWSYEYNLLKNNDLPNPKKNKPLLTKWIDWIQRKSRYSSTDVGLMVPTGVIVLWLLAFIQTIFELLNT
jgi:hypothetical protein